jgi:hypothetical protein
MKAASLTILLASGLLAESGCAVKTRTTDINPAVSRNPTCANAVQVYASRAEVPSSYREVAWIEAEGNSVWTTDSQMRSEMQKRAAEAGANGLIANPVDQNKTGVNVLGEAIGAHTATAKASGLAIWIPANAAQTRQTCGT